ncbi:MAG TPA: hypothetical protein VK923_14320 [Euzebyales bacterium]|nr:hypothetical protein [Euzebyales bacterium]
MALFTRTRTNPIFYHNRLELMLRDEPERLERMRTEPANADLLTWNVFASLDTHDDQDWLAYRLQDIGGPNLRAPVRMSLFSGRVRAPYLRPSTAYVREIHRRAGVAHGDHDGVAMFEEPIEIPVRIETPGVLLLVDTGRQRLRLGAGGRDRIAEVVDSGLEHARRLSSRLSIGIVLDGDSDVLRSEVPTLATSERLVERLPWRGALPHVELHGAGWSTALALWEDEARHLDLGGQPARAFQSYAERATG